MYENVDVQVGYVYGLVTSMRDAPWKFCPGVKNFYAGESPRYTFLYVWEGGYRHYRSDGECINVPPGSLVLFRCGTAPYYNTHAALPSRISNITFHTVKPMPVEMEMNRPLLFTPDASWETEKYFMRARWLTEEMPFGWRMQLREVVSYLLLCVLRQHFEQSRSELPPLVQESAALIRREIFDSPLTVSDVARRCRVTPTWLIRVFTEHMGVTPKKFMDQLRVERACELLLYTDKSMEEIAVASGFSEARQMRRLFHEIRGVSPMQYRRRM